MCICLRYIYKSYIYILTNFKKLNCAQTSSYASGQDLITPEKVATTPVRTSHMNTGLYVVYVCVPGKRLRVRMTEYSCFRAQR